VNTADELLVLFEACLGTCSVCGSVFDSSSQLVKLLEEFKRAAG
jgi:hypothetical protein